MVIEKCLLICCLLIFVSAVTGSSLHRKDDISDDYYFGRKELNLRTREQFKWGKVSGYSPLLISQQNNDYEDDSSSDISDEAQPEPVYVEHLALRHHIAHFCPNLDDARVCIRKCSKKGKPAFCGKDHVCYCGHSYNAHDRNDIINVADVYAQFHDMYKKYFGENTEHRSLSDNAEVQEIARGK